MLFPTDREAVEASGRHRQMQRFAARDAQRLGRLTGCSAAIYRLLATMSAVTIGAVTARLELLANLGLNVPASRREGRRDKLRANVALAESPLVNVGHAVARVRRMRNRHPMTGNFAKSPDGGSLASPHA